MRSRGRKKNGLFVVHDLLVYVPVAVVVFRTELLEDDYYHLSKLSLPKPFYNQFI